MRKGYLTRRSWTAGCAERCLSGAGESWNETCCREAARRFLRLTFCGGQSPAFHFHPTLARIQGPALVRDQIVQVRQAGEKRRLTPTGMVEPLHGEELAVDGVVRLIQPRAHRRHLGIFKDGKQLLGNLNRKDFVSITRSSHHGM